MEQIQRKAMKNSLDGRCIQGNDRFRTLNIKKSPRGKITVATRKLEDGSFLLGIAFCNPDDQFDRLRGKLIAHGRMLKNPVVFERTEGKLVKDSVKQIVVNEAFVQGIIWMNGIQAEDLV
jgi:hypothetical protein